MKGTKQREDTTATYCVAWATFKDTLWQTTAENKSSKFRQLKERLKERKKWTHSRSFNTTAAAKRSEAPSGCVNPPRARVSTQ